MQIVETAIGSIAKAIGFVKRQPRDWKVTVVRSSTGMFFYQLMFPYLSVYTMALGASATQLGIVNSAGMALAGLAAPFIGSLIDRTGVKRIYLVGIGLLAVSYLTYGMAQSWPVIVAAMAAYWLGNAGTGHSCSVICANSLADEDRATGMSLCETFASGILGIAAPMVGALLVSSFGGVNVTGIRPLFFLCLTATAATFVLVHTQLSNRSWEDPGDASSNFLNGLRQVFEQGRNLKRWLVIASINFLPIGMLLPFTQPFAHEIKGADQYILGAMVTGFALTPLLFGIPVGKLADKIGRKKVLYLTIPLVWVSSLVLIWAPSPAFLVLAGILQGFYFVSAVVTGAMTFELVPPEQMGRWLGITRFCRLLLAAGAAYLAGMIWDNLGPQYVFLSVIGLDLFIRIPLLIGMPETLGLRKTDRGEEKMGSAF
jgi:MFS family permease